ncbi:MAG: hypothetical protein K6F61_10690 [Clostridiales bacterium]|nr:hypothetical protein [Clostridiales bacterium]
MQDKGKIFAKISAAIFLLLFFVRGYDTIYAAILAYKSWYNTINLINSLIILIQAVCYLVIAIGCFRNRIMPIKFGFGLLSLAYVASIVCSPFLTIRQYNNLMIPYIISLAGMTYALILLMATKLPEKARFLGALACAVYLCGIIWYSIAMSVETQRGILWVLNYNVMMRILLLCGAVVFGMWCYFFHVSTNRIAVMLQTETDQHNGLNII